MNLYWQLSIYDRFSGGNGASDNFYATHITIDTIKTENWGIQNSLYASIGYFPNSRTQMSLGSNLSYYLYNYKNLELSPEQDETFNNDLSLRLDLGISYYISPRLRFDLNSSYYFSNEHIKYENPLGNNNSRNKYNNFNATASLVYKIL